MGRFWDAATEQAGREFGARHYRWFAGARILRRLAPTLGVLLILAGVAYAGFEGYQRITAGQVDVDRPDVDWAAAGDRATGWLPDLSTVLWWALGIAVAGLVLTIAVAVIREHWWYWWSMRPMWMRRY